MNSPPLPMEPPKNVLITRLSAIGDCVCTIPLAVRIKQLWPDCHLSWAVDCAAFQLLQDHPAIDEVIRIEKRWLKKPRSWLRIRDELRSRKFDIAFDPQGLTKSSLLGRISGARQRIGFDSSQARELAPWLATRKVARTQRHRIDTYLELLTPWHKHETGSAEFSIPNYTASKGAMLQGLGQLLPSTSRWCAINTGAGWPSKLWPAERFGALASKLKEEANLDSVVFWAGDAELSLGKDIVASSNGAAVLAPATDLRELAEALRLSEFLISSDTAALQMASALDVPCVGLFGPTWADEVGPYTNLHESVQSCLTHSNQGSIRSSTNSPMLAISVEDVFQACAKLYRQIAVNGASPLESPIRPGHANRVA